MMKSFYIGRDALYLNLPLKSLRLLLSMDIETTFYEYLKKYAGNITELKCFNLKYISLLPLDNA